MKGQEEEPLQNQNQSFCAQNLLSLPIPPAGLLKDSFPFLQKFGSLTLLDSEVCGSTGCY